MRVLVTGSRGLIGAAVAERLGAEGHGVVPFDIADGCDVLDAERFAAAAQGCEAIVHAAGGHNESLTDPGARFITHNVTGNWNMLQAAHRAKMRRVVTFSSVNAIGVFRGEARPDYLPVDDAHPIRPPTAYGVAKRLIEEMCRCQTATTGLSTIVFRPPAVLGGARRARFAEARAADPASDWTPYWEYGAWIDARDVAGAVLAALNAPANVTHLTGMIVADDAVSPVPPVEIARRIMPEVPVRMERVRGEWAPLVRDDVVRAALGWAPALRWRG